MLDCFVDEEMRSEGLAREVVNRVQKLRKKGGLQPGDPVEMFYCVISAHPPSENAVPLELSIESRADIIRSATKVPLLHSKYVAHVITHYSTV